MERIDAILEYWFEDIDEETLIEIDSDIVMKWFHPTEDQDAEVKKNFEEDLVKAKKGEYKHWEDDPRGRLALILLFDQFGRQIYRGQEKAFENDFMALELSLKSIKDGFDGRVDFVERTFFYMPLMHAESKELQLKSVEVFERHLREAERYEEPCVELFRMVLKHAEKHRDIMYQFNRFPYRNNALGRRPTSDEREFLEDPANQF